MKSDSATFDLSSLRVAAPCSQSWDAMVGDERVRHCEACKLNVFNLSNMTRDDAVALVVGTEGRVCATLLRRRDGTVLTSDCPVGLRALARRTAMLAAALTAACLGGAALGFAQTSTGRTGFAEIRVQLSAWVEDAAAALPAWMVPASWRRPVLRATTGDVVCPTPKVTPTR